MTLTIGLTPDQEARLAAYARHQGLNKQDLAQRLVTEHLPPLERNGTPAVDQNHFYYTATPEQWEAAMDELAGGGENLPVLPDEAFDRETLYEDRL